MTTEQVKLIIDRIWNEAKAPTVSFTGGEPTLRADLPEFVGYAKALGMRTNLITNGVKCADATLVRELAEAGLDSAQVSLEGPTGAVHDAITKTKGAFEMCVQGIRNLHEHHIHTHTNTTICPENRDHLVALVDFIAQELHHEYFSMNMVIRTGTAVTAEASVPGPLSAGEEGDDVAEMIGYREIEGVVVPIIERAKQHNLRMVWYSPVPYCLFNPIVHGLGGNSCAAADGLLSIAPDGQVLPCSSFETGIGNLLNEPFAKIWNRRTARYWRNKEFLPPGCATCEVKHICCGACPLYWDEQRGFADLPEAFRGGGLAEMQWRLKRRLIGKVKGVNVR